MGIPAQMLAGQGCQWGLAADALRPRAAQLSGERIITMEWMDGCKLTDLERLRDLHLHSRDVAIELLHAFAQMTFVDGFGGWRFRTSVQRFSTALIHSLLCALILCMRGIPCCMLQAMHLVVHAVHGDPHGGNILVRPHPEPQSKCPFQRSHYTKYSGFAIQAQAQKSWKPHLLTCPAPQSVHLCSAAHQACLSCRLLV